MDLLQTVTKTPDSTSYRLTPAQDEYISYVAVSGLIIHEDGSFTKMTLDEFAAQHGTTRMSLSRWSRAIPDFADKVNQRRAELYPVNRVSAIWKGLTLKAMAGNVEAAKIVLGQYGNWQPPSQKHEVTIGGLIDLARVAENKGIIEGEVIEQQPSAD